MYKYSSAEIQAQVAQLPPVFQFWFQLMFLAIVVAPIFFLRRRQGRVAIGFSIVFLVIQMPLLRTVGLTNLLSLTHLLVWGPLTLYLIHEIHERRISIQSPLGIWALIASATAIVSLVFDVRDFGRWIVGERGVVHPPPDPGMPWLWVILIVVTLGIAGAYAFRHSSLSDSTSRGVSAD